MSPSTCKMVCGPDANLWPRPQSIEASKELRAVNFNAMTVSVAGADGDNYDLQEVYVEAGISRLSSDRLAESVATGGPATCSFL